MLHAYLSLLKMQLVLFKNRIWSIFVVLLKGDLLFTSFIIWLTYTIRFSFVNKFKARILIEAGSVTGFVANVLVVLLIVAGDPALILRWNWWLPYWNHDFVFLTIFLRYFGNMVNDK